MAILKRDTLYKAFPTTFKADLSPFLRKITKEDKETTLEEALGCSAVLFLSLSILMALKRRLGKELGESEEITEEDILGTLKDMKVLREEKPARYMSLYTGSKVLEALEEAFHLGLDRKYFKASWISELSGSKPSE